MVNILRDFKDLAPVMVKYKLAHTGLVKPPMPINLTYSITAACQSLCKSCNIGLEFQKNPKMKSLDLSLNEIEKTFKSIGHVYFFNISGGEPFLRTDIPQIVELACKYLTPKVIHTPTNALTPQLIEKKTREILEIMKKNSPGVPFTIKPSFDGIGKQHDEIRGVKGNFERLMDTIKRLKALKKDYDNLDVGVGTVISRFNYKDIDKIVEFAKSLGVDSYIHEIAENRSEFFNIKDDIAPPIDEYKKLIKYFSDEIRKDLKNKNKLTRMTQAFRLVYYELVAEIMDKKKQVIPDYSGIANGHINAQGQIWANSLLGYQMPMGDLRKENYDFKKIWHSEQSDKVRKYIKTNKEYYNPIANISYTNILLNNGRMLKVFKNMILN